MSALEERLSLGEFLEAVRSRTGDHYEACALAEMAGYSVEDAQEEGWSDIFVAGRRTPVVLEVDPPAPRSVRGDELSRSFLRGLTYTAPVLAMWSILPHPMANPEMLFLGLAVVLSWGGSMASNHVVGEWMWSDRSIAWKLALRIATAAFLIAVLTGVVLAREDGIGDQAAVVGAIQVLYFFSASPLMLRKSNTPLAVISLVGATAGGLILLADSQLVSGLAQPWFPEVLPLVAVACLVAPSALLVRQALMARATPTGRRALPVRRDTVAFGAYGVMFGCLILWAPIVAPGSLLTVLSVVVIGGIAFAEVAVTRIHQRNDDLLDARFDPTAFARRARRIVLTGAAVYVVPVGLMTAALAGAVVGFTMPDVSTALPALAVMGLGAVQVLSLIGMSLHGIRQVAAAISVCAVVLLTLTPTALAGSVSVVMLYFIVVSMLALVLAVLVLRLASHPINHI